MAKYKLIKHDHDLLHQPCESVTRWRGKRIAKILIREIAKNKPIAVGMSANQIGLPYRVAVIQVKGDPIILINPEITSKENPIKATNEGCLSYPDQEKKVPRYGKIIVTHADGIMIRDIVNSSTGESYRWDEKLETIAIQHEIDHLDGITIMDKCLKPVKAQLATGRNAPCPCGSQQKYKKCCMAQ